MHTGEKLGMPHLLSLVPSQTMTPNPISHGSFCAPIKTVHSSCIPRSFLSILLSSSSSSVTTCIISTSFRSFSCSSSSWLIPNSSVCSQSLHRSSVIQRYRVDTSRILFDYLDKFKQSILPRSGEHQKSSIRTWSGFSSHLRILRICSSN